MIVLRDFQERCIQRLRDALKRGFKSLLLVSPTGSGKTCMFSYLVYRLLGSGKRVIVLDHRDELTEQISTTLMRADVPHGIIAAGMQYSRMPMAHVASVGTLVRRLESVLVPDVIVVDEAHHALPDSMWGKVIAHYRALNANLILIGVTATPERLDGSGLGATFDCMVMGPTVAELIADGWLSPYKVLGPPPAEQIRTEDMKHQGGDFARASASSASMKPAIVGSVLGHYRKYLNGAPSVAFCASIEAASTFAEKFRAEGWRAASIDGKMDQRDRRERVRDFGAGQLNVLTSCDLISEGFDVPGIVGAIKLRPTESLALDLQQSGRALRPVYAPGADMATREGRLAGIAAGPKPFAVLLDHVGNCIRHGLPDDERQWSLDGEARKKRKVDPNDVATRQCKQCFAWMRVGPPKCPNCGFVMPAAPRVIDEKEGELEEIDREKMRERLQFVRLRANSADLESLVEVGKMRGMKNPEGWAKHVLEAREKKGTRRATA